MKNLFTLFTVVFSLFSGGSLQAQSTIDFLGVTIEGRQTDVISAIEDKGFVYSYANERLEGILDGCQVWVYVITNDDGEVCRIAVADVESYDAVDIKTRYNEVFRQILDSEEYDIYQGRMVTTEDDVAAGMAEDAAQYHATFVDMNSDNGVLWFTILEYDDMYYIMRFYENVDNQE